MNTLDTNSKITEVRFPALRAYVVAMVCFSILRLLFFLYHSSRFQTISSGDIGTAFLIGLLIDSSVVATTVLAVSLLSHLLRLLNQQFALILHRMFLYSLLGFFMFINLVDIFHFETFESRLGILFLQNLGQLGPSLGTIVDDYPLLEVVVTWLTMLIFFYWMVERVTSRFKFSWWGQHPRITPLVSSVVLVGLTFLWTAEPFWRTSAFSVGNQSLNQLSLNGVYTLVKAWDQQRIIERDTGKNTYEFGSPEEAIQAIRDLIIGDNERFTDGISPLERKIVNPVSLAIQKPNIVIIIMEGLTASHIGALNPSGKGLSPGFDSLASKGILFSNLFGHETRTHHGLVSTIGSFPSVLGMFLTRRRGTESFYTLGTLLKQYGYQTSFLYGYDQGFDHMGYFLKQGGIDRIIDQKEFPDPMFLGRWGVSDEDLYEKAHKLFENQPDSPFFSILLTSSNHRPYDIPPHFLKSHPEFPENDPTAAFLYSDWALAKFFSKASQTDYFDNTIFVVVADHGESRDPYDQLLKRLHIPCLIYAQKLISEPAVIATVGGQVDIATTLMHLIGYPGSFHFVGRDLLSIPVEDGFAVLRNNETLLYLINQVVLARDIRDTLSQLYAVDNQGRVISDSTITNEILQIELNQRLEDYLQVLHQLYTAGRHRFTDEY